MNGPICVFAQTLTSGQTLPATGIDLGSGWDKMYLQIPAMASGSVQAYFAADSVATYFPATFRNTATHIVQSVFMINSALTSTIFEIPPAGRYFKVRNTSVCTDVHTTYKIICS